MIIVLLLGPPAVGKGTQGKKIGATFDIPVISTGQLVRDFIAQEDCKMNLYLTEGSEWEQAKLIEFRNSLRITVEAGKLISDADMQKLLAARLNLSDCKRGFVLDGFPRTYQQALYLQSLDALDDAYFITIAIEIDIDTAVKRITGRITCKHCGASYGDALHPRIEGRCDYCNGTEFYHRTDDSEHIVRARFQQYEEGICDIIRYYHEQSLIKDGRRKFLSIDGMQNPDEINQSIITVIGEVFSSQ